MSDHNASRRRPWWTAQPILKTVGVSAVVLIVGAIVVAWHIETTGQTPTAPHKASGDLLFFGVIGIVLVLGTILIVSRQRASIAGDEVRS